MKIGDSVLITGETHRLLMLQLAIKSGASIVLVSEPIAEKRQLAKTIWSTGSGSAQGRFTGDI